MIRIYGWKETSSRIEPFQLFKTVLREDLKQSLSRTINLMELNMAEIRCSNLA